MTIPERPTRSAFGADLTAGRTRREEVNSNPGDIAQEGDRRTRQRRADKLCLCKLAEQALDVSLNEVRAIQPEPGKTARTRQPEELPRVALPEVGEPAQPNVRHLASPRRPDSLPLRLFSREQADNAAPDLIGLPAGLRLCFGSRMGGRPRRVREWDELLGQLGSVDSRWKIVNERRERVDRRRLVGRQRREGQTGRLRPFRDGRRQASVREG